MKIMKISTIISCILLCISCKKEANNSLYGSSSEALYFSFTTPDWSEHIDCSHLELDATRNYVLSAQSQSTKEIFYMIVPTDSSSWSQQKIKKHAIGTDSAFQFNQTLPITKGSNQRMLGISGLNDSSYNEITSIKYSNSDNSGSYFFIKGNYKMWMLGINSNSTKKFVTGSYSFKVKTTKN